MTAQQPPRNSQANEAANARSCNDSRAATAACPLMSLKLQLVPLRYGIVEHLDPSSEVAMPFSLESRPMGVRQLRDGFLYVIEEQTGYLHEYEIVGGNLNKLLWQGAEVSSNTRTNIVGPAKLVFSRQSTLHVAYSEIQWTAAKCSQVLGSAEERRHFMQQVNPGSANPATGGTHLMTWRQTESWLAEVAESRQEPELPEGADPDENLPYLWETPSLFKETSIDVLKGQVLAEYKDDSLCLVIRDDIGVMRDLANFQDKVVGWIDGWAEGGEQPGANERDYMLACYIESLSQITAQGLNQVADLTDKADVQAMLEDLENLPEPEQGNTRQAISDYLNDESSNGRSANPSDPTHPSDLKALLDEVRSRATRTNSAVIVEELNKTTEAYYAIQRHFGGLPNSAFLDKYRGALTNLKKEQNQRVRAMLEGKQFGQRGINDLIDRPAMDAVLERDRTNLARWNALLDNITNDRLEMAIQNRFHLAAWYYDISEAEQIGLAFSSQYACFKDICRSDNAIESIHDWIEQQPDYDRPLFFTLPLSTQTQLSTQLATLNGAGYSLVSNTSEWVNQLRDIESPFLPALDDLSESARVVGQSAHETLNPALAYGLSRTLNRALQATSAQQIPSLEELFAGLPKATTRRMFDAARVEGVTFSIATDQDLASLHQNIDEVLEKRAEQTRLNNRHDLVKKSAGHTSDAAKRALSDFHEVRDQRLEAEKRLFDRLNPISELPDSNTRLIGAGSFRPGLSLTFPAAQHQAVTNMWHSLRHGYLQAPVRGILGDGAGLLVAIAQAVNLRAVLSETLAQASHERDWSNFFGAAMATASAGFMAAQAIVDTALTARGASLARSLQSHSLEGVHVAMGKLHFPLGMFGYGAGLFVSINNFRSYNNNWQEAVRKGNTAAQHGASLGMMGAAGMTGANFYGFSHSAHAGWTAMRGGSWAAAGARLSTVFMRFNLAGALFTVIELGGTWWYHRQNISRHDAWLQITPWGRDTSKRSKLSLNEYQDRLQNVLHAPVAQLRHTGNENWAKNMLGIAQGIDVDVMVAGLNLSALQSPVGIPAPIQLYLAGYEIRAVGRRQQRRWRTISEDLVKNVRLKSDEPLQLTVDSAAFSESSARLELLLVVRIEVLDGEGRYQAKEHNIRLRTHNEGDYLTAEQQASGTSAPRLILDPFLLTRQNE